MPRSHEPDWGMIDRLYNMLVYASVYGEMDRVMILKNIARKRLCEADYQLLRADVSFAAQQSKRA